MYQIERANYASPLLGALEKHTEDPFMYDLPRGFPCGFKSEAYVLGKQISGSVSSVYDREYAFKIPMNNGFLMQAYIECTLTCTGDNSLCQDRLGTKVFSSVSLETRSGRKVIQTLTPEYISARIEGLDYTLNSHVENSVEPDQLFNNNSVVVYVPCFFYFSERKENALNTNALEPIQITAIINSTKESMGLVADLTEVSFRLLCRYFTLFKESQSSVPRNLSILAYDSYKEPIVALSSGATSKKITLTCNMTCFAMHIMITNTNTEYHPVKNFEMKFENKTINSLNRRVNYEFYNSKNSHNTPSGVYTYWFSLEHNRFNNTMSLPLRHLNPCSLEVFFDAVPSTNYSMTVLFEYWTILNIDGSTGNIERAINY